MTKWWEDKINLPKEPEPVKPKRPAEEVLREGLEGLETFGLNARKGSAAWHTGIKAKIILDEAYGRERNA